MDAYLVLLVVFGCFLTLIISKKEPELVFGTGLVCLLIFGLVSVEGALSGFSNPGFATVASLYVLAAGIRDAGLIRPFIAFLLNNTQNYRIALLRVTLPVAFLSSFLNNTPIVAALIPGITKWCSDKNWDKKLFLLPISYAAILGGTCTLIGTSTNLLIFGFMQQSENAEKLGFFEIGLVGLPLTLVGIVYLFFMSKRLLRHSEDTGIQLENTREYTVEMMVDESGPLVGKTIEQAQLRQLKGLYLIEIIRGSLIMAAIGPSTRLSGGDRLVFTGVVTSISDLISIDGLKVAEDQVFKLGGNTGRANLVEAVIGANHPLIGKSVKQGNFRRRYNAAIIAVLREGKRLKQKVGDIKLKPGDTLLMLARRSFVEQHSFSRDFMLVKGNNELVIAPKNKRRWAWGITLLFVGCAASGVLSVVEAAILSAILMVISGCVTLEHARQSIDLQVLLTIAAAFGIGEALKASGGAALMAEHVINLTGDSPFALLVATYLMTVLLTELVTNNAAAVISYSLVSGLVFALGYNLVPYAVAIMIAASASFISPLGYQTNLMVYGAGRYQFNDYLKLGVPLSIISALISLFLIPYIWNLN